MKLPSLPPQGYSFGSLKRTCSKRSSDFYQFYPEPSLNMALDSYEKIKTHFIEPEMEPKQHSPFVFAEPSEYPQRPKKNVKEDSSTEPSDPDKMHFAMQQIELTETQPATEITSFKNTFVDAVEAIQDTISSEITPLKGTVTDAINTVGDFDINEAQGMLENMGSKIVKNVKTEKETFLEWLWSKIKFWGISKIVQSTQTFPEEFVPVPTMERMGLYTSPSTEILDEEDVKIIDDRTKEMAHYDEKVEKFHRKMSGGDNVENLDTGKNISDHYWEQIHAENRQNVESDEEENEAGSSNNKKSTESQKEEGILSKIKFWE